MSAIPPKLPGAGRRRLAWYAFASAVALAFGGFAVYLIAEVALGRKYTWTLAMLPASLAVSAFSILLAYGGRSWVVTRRLGRPGLAP